LVDILSNQLVGLISSTPHRAQLLRHILELAGHDISLQRHDDQGGQIDESNQASDENRYNKPRLSGLGRYFDLVSPILRCCSAGGCARFDFSGNQHSASDSNHPVSCFWGSLLLRSRLLLSMAACLDLASPRLIEGGAVWTVSKSAATKRMLTVGNCTGSGPKSSTLGLTPTPLTARKCLNWQGRDC
jgi:hypothetical protein